MKHSTRAPDPAADLAAQRLATSRSRLLQARWQAAPLAASGRGTATAGWLDSALAAAWAARPGASDRPGAWLQPAANALLQPWAQRQPWALLATAALTGAVLWRVRPWRWGAGGLRSWGPLLLRAWLGSTRG
jgi:hypothetical protein